MTTRAQRITLIALAILVLFVGVATAQEAVDADEDDPIGDLEFIVWISLALTNGGLAQIKNSLARLNEESEGMGGLGWFLLSLLLGPFATFFIVVFKD